MSNVGLLLFALLARLLPGGWGLVVAPLAATRRVGRPAICGLFMLSLSTTSSSSFESTRTDLGVHAVQLTGQWRSPPGQDSYLNTTSGDVAIQLAADLSAPPPGAIVTVLARLDSSGRATGIHISDQHKPSGAWIDRWCATAVQRIRSLAGAHRGLVEALLLGRRESLPPTTRDDCIATGTMHLFALSGLHVALLTAAVLRIPGLGRASTLASLASILAFLALTGSRPSLMRASLSWLGLTTGLLSGRAGHALPRLLAVALALAVISPRLAQDLGAQLSFLAVGGLLAAVRLVRGGWLGPAGAFLTTAPLCLEVFGRVQPWGLLITPLLVPAVALLLITGVVAVFPGMLLAGLDPLTGPLLRGSADALTWLLHASAFYVPAPWTPPPFPLPGALVSLAVLAALLALPSCRKHAATSLANNRYD
ncbi:MAG: ComEC/Rec2 family competence protein [Planctomycetota bacterium]|nr:ComEC/Rec2 family competence protein [Planctomycetota bacterium]